MFPYGGMRAVNPNLTRNTVETRYTAKVKMRKQKAGLEIFTYFFKKPTTSHIYGSMYLYVSMDLYVQSGSFETFSINQF